MESKKSNGTNKAGAATPESEPMGKSPDERVGRKYPIWYQLRAFGYYVQGYSSGVISQLLKRDVDKLRADEARKTCSPPPPPADPIPPSVIRSWITTNSWKDRAARERRRAERREIDRVRREISRRIAAHGANIDRLNKSLDAQFMQIAVAPDGQVLVGPDGKTILVERDLWELRIDSPEKLYGLKIQALDRERRFVELALKALGGIPAKFAPAEMILKPAEGRRPAMTDHDGQHCPDRDSDPEAPQEDADDPEKRADDEYMRQVSDGDRDDDEEIVPAEVASIAERVRERAARKAKRRKQIDES